MKKKGFFVFSILILLYNINLFSQYTSFNKKVNKKTSLDILSEVNLDTLIRFVRELSGETPVILNGKLDSIISRNKYHADTGKATIYLKQKLESYGYNTQLQKFFNPTNRFNVTNVIATLPGVKYPNIKYIICAHYDDMPSGGKAAPGADDNASGTAAVLEAARIFSKYKTEYTVVFALWDAEEQGKIGSNYYAYYARAANDSIAGVLNLDMIAYDSNNDNLVEIHTKNVANSEQLANFLIDLNNSKQIGLTLNTINPGASGSDHYSFWLYNYSAILLIETYTGTNRDFNPYYHSINDKIIYFNMNYFIRCSKLTIQALAELSKLTSQPIFVEGTDNLPSDFTLYQNYPNPFNATTQIFFDLPYNSQVKLKIYNTLGKEVDVLFDSYLRAGKHRITWNAYNNPSGIYYFKLETEKSFCIKKTVLMK